MATSSDLLPKGTQPILPSGNRALLTRLRKASHWQFGLVVVLLTAITFAHYVGRIEEPDLLARLLEELGLSRHALERILYLVPMIWSGFLFGRRGVLATSVIALACMLPRVVLLSPHPMESLFETGAVFVIGGWAGLSSAMLVEERDRHLELGTLYLVSSDVARSLDLDQVFDNVLRSVIEALRVDLAMIFLVDEESGELVLTASRGLSGDLSDSCSRLDVGASLNGVVVRSGQTMYVADSQKDPRLTNESVRLAGVRSQLIVPLRVKDEVEGTLCVAMCAVRSFRPGEVALLSAIGNHLGVAVEKSRLYVERERMEENLHYYLQQITRAQEEERKRIARELHDDTIQALVIHSRRLDELVSSQEGPEQIAERLEDLLQDTNEIVQGVRRMSRDLRPATLDRLGLLPALERLALDTAEEGMVAVDVRPVGKERRLSDEAAITLFRIAQEALNNVRRHAQAKRAEILVEFLENRIRLTVTDDGKGFAPRGALSSLARDGKLGLAGMEERARLLGGRVQIDSEIGRGTKVSVEVPL